MKYEEIKLVGTFTETEQELIKYLMQCTYSEITEVGYSEDITDCDAEGEPFSLLSVTIKVLDPSGLSFCPNCLLSCMDMMEIKFADNCIVLSFPRRVRDMLRAEIHTIPLDRYETYGINDGDPWEVMIEKYVKYYQE